MGGVKPSLRDGNGTAVLLFRSHLYVGTLAFRRSEVSQRETGRFKRGVETVGVHPFFALAPRRRVRSRRPQTAKSPSPATAYCSAGSAAPENGCRGTGFPVEIFSGGDPIFAQIPRTACATILLRGPRTESTVLSTNLWIIPCKSAPHRRNFYAQSSHHRSGPNPPAAPLPYPLERRPVRAQRRRFAADRPG